MKRNLLLIILLTLGIKGYSLNEKIRLGLQVSPGIAWSKPMGKDLLKGKPRFGTSYGFVLEYWFAKNYGLATGLGGSFDGCNIQSRDAFQTYDTAGNITRTVNEKYAFHYLELPFYLKFKTNDIKDSKFSVWGQLGIVLNATVSARATYDNPILLLIKSPTEYEINIEKENILKKNNDVTRSIKDFRSNFIDVRLGAGGGFEYRFDEKASLLVGLFYHNGFINNILDKSADPKKEPNVMRFMSLRVGVLF